jgi:hypothetical protein
VRPLASSIASLMRGEGFSTGLKAHECSRNPGWRQFAYHPNPGSSFALAGPGERQARRTFGSLQAAQTRGCLSALGLQRAAPGRPLHRRRRTRA